MSRPKATIFILLCMIIVLYLYYVYLSVEIGSLSVPYTQLSSELNTLSVQNKDLRQQLLDESSLRRIYEKAIDMGFIPRKEYIIIR